MFLKRKRTSKEDEKLVKSDIAYVNIPISSKEEDKIGIEQYARELRSVIKKGAQSIAVTSDFGGGKSSLIRYLETLYLGIFTKFCYVNLWGQFRGDMRDVHKAFIYQLASQINKRKGNYVSKRLSKNYCLFSIALPNVKATVLSFVMFLLLVIGFACTNLYELIKEYISIKFLKDYHNNIGVIAFVFVIFFGLIFLYKSDIVFPAKKSIENRDIDEHELMDVYRSFICKFHFKHYIVIVEDLDRSDAEKAAQFIKELRRYYIPCKRKRSKCRFVNWFFDNVVENINRITFIVNIKSEIEIDKEYNGKLYAKAFDYVLNLKEVNIDNYDVILRKLLQDNRLIFEKNNIPLFVDGKKIRQSLNGLLEGRN